MRETAATQAAARLPDEAVHAAMVDVAYGVYALVRPAEVADGGVVERPHAGAALRVRDADGEAARPPREPVSAGVRAEIGVERAVLLHHDHDVSDLVNPERARVRPRHAAEEQPEGCGGSGQEEDDRQPPDHTWRYKALLLS